jgi:hypothetical protein
MKQYNFHPPPQPSPLPLQRKDKHTLTQNPEKTNKNLPIYCKTYRFIWFHLFQVEGSEVY